MRAHHDGSELYVSSQSPALGETVSLFVRVPAGIRATRIHLRRLSDGEPVFTSAVVDRTDRNGDVWWRAEMPVRNLVTPYRFLVRTSQGVRWLTGAGLTHYDVPDATDFRIVAHPAPPAWARDAVVYQIFPDRFASSSTKELPAWATGASWGTPSARGPNATKVLYGGDLDGIAQRLDHIAELGANTLYLTPFFPGRSNHRYDASTFDRVDPLLGGDESLIKLSRAVHDRGWRLLGDLTTNHTGTAHPWFASERSFYYFKPGGGYECWMGHPSLPKLNWGSADLRRRFAELTQRWLAAPFGLDGWRIDVANMTGRRGADDWTHEVATLLRKAVHEARPDGLLIAEHAHDATTDLDRDGWHGTMNYAGFTRPVWSWLRADNLPFDDFLGVPVEVPHRDAAQTVAAMSAFSAQMSWRSWTTSWQMLGSHDTARIRTVVGDAARQEVATGLLLTLPGTPMIFAGDEFGLTGATNESARQPMPWGSSSRTFDTYQALIRLRRAQPALRHGGLRWVHAAGDTLAYLRESAGQTLLVLARRRADGPLRLTGLPGDTSWENLYGGDKPLYTGTDGSTSIDGYGPAFQVWVADT
ncbi:alpha-amylase family glycosyl hydrolase [Actinoplanes sp. CA-142083]|uniref:glycoside hydrolase family 13 protein n=1 Tax=Actinoplanes sp. CA-142083 TaxID=3239903 RepID=UPI003D8F88B7